MALKLNSSSGGSVTLQEPTTASNYTLTVPAQTATLATTVDAGNYYAFKNRIINGNMAIDQRNAGASVTVTNTGGTTYIVDRWGAYGTQASKFSVQQNAGSVTPPNGFKNYLGVTSLSAYSVTSTDYFFLTQPIEGYNIADLGFGTANAQAFTISFWVRSSLTGTFGGAIVNSAYNRSYPFSYTINAANTWEQKTVTITADTTGTWESTSSAGLRLQIGLGSGANKSGTAGSWAAAEYATCTGATSVVGTSGATFYITGVQLEKGTVATSFDYRPYGTELALCQRYYQTTFAPGTAPAKGITANDWWTTCSSGPFGNNLYGSERFKVAMRASPSLYFYNSISSGAADNTVYGYWASSNGTLGVSMDSIATHGFGGAFTGTGIITHGFVRSHYTASAEL